MNILFDLLFLGMIRGLLRIFAGSDWDKRSTDADLIVLDTTSCHRHAQIHEPYTHHDGDRDWQ